MKRLFHFSTRTLRILMIVVIVSAALLLLAGRLLSPMISDYRSYVEQWATETLHQPVSVGRLEGGWSGLGPVVILRDLTLLSNSGIPRLKLAEVHIAINIPDSLANGTPTPRRIVLVGPKLKVLRQRDGSISVVGLQRMQEKGEQESGDTSGTFLLPAHIDVRGGEVLWEDQLTGADPLHLNEVDLNLRNGLGRHQLSGNLQIAGKNSPINLAVDLFGNPLTDSSWFADFYFQGKDLHLQSLLSSRIPQEYRIGGGVADLEIWGRLRNGRLQRLEGLNQWQALDISRQLEDQAGTRLEIDRLGSRFLWQNRESGWDLELRDLQLSQGGIDWPKTRLSMSVRDQNGNTRLELGSDYINLDNINSIARLLPLPLGDIRPALDQIAPKGVIRDFRFRFHDASEGPRWSARGGAEGISSSPWKEIPGVQNLGFRFWIDQHHGSLLLDSRDAMASFPELFRQPLILGRLEGLLSWERLESGSWEVWSSRLAAANRDISTVSRLLLQVPAASDQSIFMDLQTDYLDGDASNTSHYLPTGIMPDALVEWLDRSIKGGEVVNGSLVVRGPLSEFPFEASNKGRFEVFFTAREVELDYWPGWPKLRNMTAEVRFLNNRFDAWVSSGRILESKTLAVHGQIADLALTSPFELTGTIEGPFSDTLRILTESPLAEQFGSLAQGLKGAGKSRLELGFAIPIDTGEFHLDGNLRFQGATLQLVDWQLPLTDLMGNLEFNQSGILAENIRGKILGNDFRVDVSTPEGNRDVTRITALGSVPSSQLVAHFPKADFLKSVHGEGYWQLELDVPHLEPGKKQPVSAAILTNLMGIEIDQPAPLGKSAMEPRRLEIRTALTDGPRKRLRIHYGELFDIALQMRREEQERYRIESANILLGGGYAQLPKEPGIRISGQMNQLDLDPWLEMNQQHPDKTQLPPLKSIDLSFGTLLVNGRSFSDITLKLKREPEALVGKVAGKQFNGKIRIPDDLETKPIHVALDQLRLEFDPEQLGGDTNPGKASPDETRPDELPALELEVAQLLINDKPFGKLSMHSRKIANGLQMQRLNLESEQLRLASSGFWTVDPDDQHTTDVQASFSCQNLGEVLVNLGFAKNIEGAPTQMESHLHWNATPRDFSRENLSGRIKMQIRKGQFLTVSPGVGRIFGLLNLSALQRRLTLDFSDIFKKGFAFDSIVGSFVLENGDAYTSDFAMAGPSASIEITGRIGLVKEDFDQLVTVTPKISSSLPLAGAIAGGPAVGAALFLAQKLVGDKFDKVTQVQYIVTGPWLDPTLTPRITKTAPASEIDGEHTLKAEAGDPRQKEWQVPTPSEKSLEAARRLEMPENPGHKKAPANAGQQETPDWELHQPAETVEKSGEAGEPPATQAPAAPEGKEAAEENKKTSLFRRLLKKLKLDKPASQQQDPSLSPDS